MGGDECYDTISESFSRDSKDPSPPTSILKYEKRGDDLSWIVPSLPLWILGPKRRAGVGPSKGIGLTYSMDTRT
jgi:hypothetical protein